MQTGTHRDTFEHVFDSRVARLYGDHVGGQQGPPTARHLRRGDGTAGRQGTAGPAQRASEG